MSERLNEQQLDSLIQEAYRKARAEIASEVDERKRQYDYYHERWTQLNGLASNYTDMSIKFLYTTNLAAAGGVITFIGAVAELREFAWPYWAFFIFLTGVLLSGLLKVYLLHRSEMLRDGLKDDYVRLVHNELTWGQFMEADEKRVDRRKLLPYCLGYLTLGLFIAGVLLVLSSILAGWLPQKDAKTAPTLCMKLDSHLGSSGVK